jgi:hypothetical protein
MMMDLEPFGHGDRWYHRLGGGNLKPKEFAIIAAIVVTLAIAWQLFG